MGRREEAQRIDLGRSLVAQAQAAELLRLSERTLENWRVRGQGPRYIKVGRAVRYSITDLETFAAAGARLSTGSAPEGV